MPLHAAPRVSQLQDSMNFILFCILELCCVGQSVRMVLNQSQALPFDALAFPSAAGTRVFPLDLVQDDSPYLLILFIILLNQISLDGCTRDRFENLTRISRNNIGIAAINFRPSFLKQEHPELILIRL